MANTQTKKKLTKKYLNSLLPRAMEYVVWDAEVPGFGVRISKGGRRSFLIKYRIENRQRKMTLGMFGELTVDQARTLALKARADIRTGNDPQEHLDKQKNSPTVESAFKEFCKAHEGKWRPKTTQGYQWNYKNHIAPILAKRIISSISYSDAEQIHRKLRSQPYSANRTLALLSALIAYCIKRRWYVSPNPCGAIDHYDEKPRERVVTAGEFERLGEVLNSYSGNLLQQFG